MGDNDVIVKYSEFCDLIRNEYEGPKGFANLLIERLIDKPQRFIGKFRLSNSKTKLLQNILYSREIAFGKILEQLFTMYFERIGYRILSNDLGSYENNSHRRLVADILFKDDTNVYLIEMKVRDDHDNSKADGQLENFDLKIQKTIDNYPNKNVKVYMWFVDDSFKQHQVFYQNHIEDDKRKHPGISIQLVYGSGLFNNFERGNELWNEFLFLLERYKDEHENDILVIPDFKTDKDVLKALIDLPENLWKKLNSEKDMYQQLRLEYFGENDDNSNFNKAKGIRKQQKKNGRNSSKTNKHSK